MRKVFKLVEIELDELKRGDLFMLYDVGGGVENLDKVYLARGNPSGEGIAANVPVLDKVGALMACRETELGRGMPSG